MKRAFGVKKDKEPPASIQDASDKIVKWKRVATLFQASSFMLLFQTGTQALESSGTWVIEFRGEEEKITWLRGLIRATYEASAPTSVDILGETSDGISESDDPQTRKSKAADLVINGAVVETKLYIYGKTGEGVAEKLEEQLILEVLASGGKITVYFMELATPHTEEVIKLVDKVGDFECLVQKSEIDGTTALKLDLKLDSPIIIVPRNSLSREKRSLRDVFRKVPSFALEVKSSWKVSKIGSGKCLVYTKTMIQGQR